MRPPKTFIRHVAFFSLLVGGSCFFLLGQARATDDTEAPSTPSDLNITTVSSAGIGLSWSASTDNVGVVGYEVYRDGSRIATVSGTSYQNTGLAPSRMYLYSVAAFDAAQNMSAFSGGAGTTTSAIASDTAPPSVPTEFIATAISPSQINLSWTASTDNTGVVGYKIYRNGTLFTTIKETSYSNTGLTAGVVYVYGVAAYDAAGNLSAQALSQNIVTTNAHVGDTQAPSVPVDIIATVVSSSQIKLSWSVSTDNVGVTGYKVYRDGTVIATVTSNLFVDTGLVASTAYSYTIAAVDLLGNTSAQSEKNSATTQSQPTGTVYDGAPPTVPTGFAAIATSSSQIYLSWIASTDNVGVVGYKIYRNGKQIATVTGNSYSDIGLDEGVSYLYAVAAYDVTGNESAKTANQSATTLIDDRTTPSVPSGLTVTAVSASQINLSWTASTDNVGIAGYKIFRNDSEISTVTVTSYADTGLSEKKLYTYAIAAYDKKGNISSRSISKSATTKTVVIPDSQAPSVPTNVFAIAVSSSEINLSWTASSDNVGVAGYKIYQNGALIATVAGTAYKRSGLTPFTSYSYTVFAYDGAGNKSDVSKSAYASTFMKAAEENKQPTADTEIISSTIKTVGTAITNTNEVSPTESPMLSGEETANPITPKISESSDTVISFSNYMNASQALTTEARSQIPPSATVEEQLKLVQEIREKYALAPAAPTLRLGSTTVSRLEDPKQISDMVDHIVSERTVAADTDGDTISDYDETYIYGTDPKKSDTDGDGIADNTELLAGTDPLLKNIAPVAYEDPKQVKFFSGTASRTLKVEKADPIFSKPEGETAPKVSGIILSGTAFPDSFITLYVFSTPVVVTIKTDSDGRWTYSVEKDMENGTHHVYVAMTESSGKIITRSNPFPFVKTAEAVSLGSFLPSAEAATSKQGFLGIGSLTVAIGVIGLVVLSGLVALSIILKRKVPADSGADSQKNI